MLAVLTHGLPKATVSAAVPSSEQRGGRDSRQIWIHRNQHPWILISTCLSIALCSTPLAASPLNGACGSPNGVAVSSAPTSNLCRSGTASAVSGSGPWTWNCKGSGGGAAAACSAPLTSSADILPTARNASANWKMAGMLSVGGIPTRTSVCATLSPLGSDVDDTTQIDNAITACPLGEAVLLRAGTFTIAEGSYIALNKGVTLRGSGPGTTILTRTDGATPNSFAPGGGPGPMIIAGPQRYNNNTTSANLTTDAVQGSHSVSVTSASGLSVGQIVLLDEYSGASFQTEPLIDPNPHDQILAAPDSGDDGCSTCFRVQWQLHNPGQSYDDPLAATTPVSGAAASWFSRQDRPTSEYHKISAISGTTITFDSPITISYRVSHTAQLSHYATAFTTLAGIESLTVSNGDNDNIDFIWCAYCWAHQVESKTWLGDGFAINNSFRVQLEEIYVHDADWPVPGGGGYAISLANGSSEILIENSISVIANKVMVARSSGAGSVVAYNYMDDGFISSSGETDGDTWQEIGLNGSHMVGGHHMLFEGNYSFNIDSDDTHGNSIYMTYFRNWATGYRTAFTNILDTPDTTVIDDLNDLPKAPNGTGTNGPLRAAGSHIYSYWMSFIGNVLGTSGHTSGWTYNCTGGGIPTKCIWDLGWMDIEPQPYDPNVAATAVRDGNYDYVTNSIAWASNDTAHTLPNSLYLSAKPAFFNAGSGYTWPWVVPNGSPQLHTLPAQARYEAGTPFTQP
jgi:hypothetical protein